VKCLAPGEEGQGGGLGQEEGLGQGEGLDQEEGLGQGEGLGQEVGLGGLENTPPHQKNRQPTHPKEYQGSPEPHADGGGDWRGLLVQSGLLGWAGPGDWAER